ncbi:MAG: endonuclease/exonuclease/phosphatase family protein [Chloroflexia bacterium]|nr:endonuclease/exonuclease/phosphatase family protein [Chloroflexia bacterium]
MKVLSFNIFDGGKKRLAEISGMVRRHNPDVVALLEANSRSNVTALARELGMHQVFGKANSRHHIAWLSRLPIERSENYRLPILSKTLLEIEVIWREAPLRLFATHLAGGADSVHPAEEVPSVLDVLRPVGGQPHLLVGDFNALRPCDPVGIPPNGDEEMSDGVDADPRQTIRLILQAGYLDCYRVCNPDTPGYTYPTDSPWLRLDYIFASPELTASLHRCDIDTCDGAQRASDHFPVWAEFR